MKIEIWGNLLQITPGEGQNLLTLKQELSYTHKGFEQVYERDSTGRTRVKEQMSFENRHLFEEVSGRIVTSTGFLPRVIDYCRTHSIAVETLDYRSINHPDASYAQLKQLRPGQAEMLACIAAHKNGVLVAPTAFGKSFTIVEVCKMYPTLKIQIVSPAVDVINTVYSRLKLELPESELGMFGGGKKHEGRITLTTSASILKVDPDKVDLLLFDEVHTAAGPAISRNLGKFSNARMFGFTASPKGRSDGAELVIESIFGPTRFTREYQEAADDGSIVPIDVHIYTVPGTNTYTSAMQRKRQGIWTHRQRNTLIASLAQDHGDDQVLILVDTLEHLLHLKKLLPDFECVFGKPAAPQLKKFKKQRLIDDDFNVPDNKELDAMRVAFEANELKRVIATGKWAVGVDFVHLRVCIRADAGGSDIKSVQLPGRVARTADGKDVGTLIDFADNHEAGLNRRAKGRLKIYRDLGWKITEHGVREA